MRESDRSGPDQPRTPGAFRQVRPRIGIRCQLIADRIRERNRTQKAIDRCGVRVGGVLTDLIGVNTRCIHNDLVQGLERAAIFGSFDANVSAKITAFGQALAFDLDSHARWLLADLLGQYDALTERLERLGRQIQTAVAPWDECLRLLQTVPGIDRNSACAILAEFGPDLSPFARSQDVAAWAGVAPGNHESAGKRRPARRTTASCGTSLSARPGAHFTAKKRELVGDSKNGGRERQPKGKPEQSLVHGFPQDYVGKATPYGTYDIAGNKAWVNVGREHDTPAFAVPSLRRRWNERGKRRYGDAHDLFIAADAGGSNRYRSRTWKHGLQQLADQTRLRIHVSQFPPGTSKWNKVEHRLLCSTTQNWRRKPLRTFETIVGLIGNTRTAAKLRVKSKLDKRKYPTRVTISNAEMNALSLHRNEFHSAWNYELHPR